MQRLLIIETILMFPYFFYQYISVSQGHLCVTKVLALQMSLQEGSLLWVPQSKFTWRPAAILKITSARNSVLLRWLDSNDQETVDLATFCSKNSLLYECAHGCTPQIDLSGLDFINEPEGEVYCARKELI